MEIPRKYLHDTQILVLVSTAVFLAFLCAALVLLRSGIGQGVESYIISYRANLGLGGYERAGLMSILAFIGFSIVTLLLGLLLSVRTYALRRSLAITVLLLTILLQIFTILVSNALLTLY